MVRRSSRVVAAPWHGPKGSPPPPPAPHTQPQRTQASCSLRREEAGGGGEGRRANPDEERKQLLKPLFMPKQEKEDVLALRQLILSFGFFCTYYTHVLFLLHCPLR